MNTNFLEIKNVDKLNGIMSHVVELDALKRAIDGINDVIKSNGIMYRLISDDNAQADIHGIKYEVEQEAFRAMKSVFEKAYNICVAELDKMLDIKQ